MSRRDGYKWQRRPPTHMLIAIVDLLIHLPRANSGIQLPQVMGFSTFSIPYSSLTCMPTLVSKQSYTYDTLLLPLSTACSPGWNAYAILVFKLHRPGWAPAAKQIETAHRCLCLFMAPARLDKGLSLLVNREMFLSFFPPNSQT